MSTIERRSVGDIIRDEVSVRQTTVTHVARCMDVTVETLVGLIENTTEVTPEIAIKLQAALGLSDEYWMNQYHWMQMAKLRKLRNA